jgi:O-antigen ligase
MILSFNLKNIKKFALFFLLFSINIGFKEIFRLFDEEIEVQNLICIITIILFSIVSTILSFNLIKNYKVIFLISIFLFSYLFFSSLFTLQPLYGIQKAFLGILLPLVVFSLFARIKWTKDQILIFFVYVAFLLSFVAIIYKIKSGFFEREINYGVLGPIPFGWVNGFAFLIVALKKNKKLAEYLSVLFFLSMVLWSGSKGPLLALLVVSLFNFNKILGSKKITKFIMLFLLIGVVFVINLYAEEFRAVRSLLAFFEDPEDYSDGVGSGSVGTRLDYLNSAFNLFLENPLFGNGFGSFVEIGVSHKYPHNVYIELLSETGLFAFLLLIFIILKNSFKGIGQGVLFILICLSFSGDFSYFRYALYPLLISTFISKNFIK